MQDPVRYYITKRGEESTVRSVKVARRRAKIPWRRAPTRPPSRRRQNDLFLAPAKAVERLVKGAIRGRSSQRSGEHLANVASAIQASWKSQAHPAESPNGIR